jgi:hypothetical protein
LSFDRAALRKAKEFVFIVVGSSKRQDTLRNAQQGAPIGNGPTLVSVEGR